MRRTSGWLALDVQALSMQVRAHDYGVLLGQALFQDSVRDAFLDAQARSADRLAKLLQEHMTTTVVPIASWYAKEMALEAQQWKMASLAFSDTLYQISFFLQHYRADLLPSFGVGREEE